MTKRAQSVGLTTTSPEFVLKQGLPPNKHNHGKLPNGKLKAEAEATEPLVIGPNRYPCKQNVHLLHTANDHLPVEYYIDDYQEQCYSLETWQIHIVHRDSAKKKYFVTLPMSATGNKLNDNRNDISDRHRRHVQYPV